MMALYTSTEFARDNIAIIYYSIVLTAITIVAAMIIGVIQLLSLILNVAEPEGPFWDGVAAASDHYDIIGGCICASFVVFGCLSVLLYSPWRRRIDRRRGAFESVEQNREAEVAAGLENQREEPIGGNKFGQDAALHRSPSKTVRATEQDGVH
jgi:nickel/cobalt transporter (NiCoT) family protein